MHPLIAVMLLASGRLGPQDPGDINTLTRRIRHLADSSGAAVGVGIRHLETGQEWYLNGDRAFLMGSTFKIPVAVELLTKVDRGETRLDRLVPLLAGDIFPSGSLLSERFRDPRDPGAHLALRRYLELMLILSDNSATEVVLRGVGGPPAVTERIRRLGIAGMRVDRTTMDIYRDYTGLRALPPVEERNLDIFMALLSGQTRDQLAAAQQAFHASEKDRTTPRAMIELLTKIWRREALSPAGTEELLAIMRREETGRGSIRRFLPTGTPVANKTGAIGSLVINDVAIIDLPGQAGHFALAVYSEDQSLNDGPKERLIADIAKAAYDHFRVPAGPKRP